MPQRPILGLLAAAALVLSAACGGDGAPSCPDAPPLTAAQWSAASAALDASIEAAKAGDATRAVDLFFAYAHDGMHLAASAACKTDNDASKRLQKSLDDLHFEFDPNNAQTMVRVLTRVRDATAPVVRSLNLTPAP